MSFSFGFSGDDIEDDGQNEEQAGGPVNEMLKHSISEHTAAPFQTIEPNVHTLRELVSFQFLTNTSYTKSLLFSKQIYQGSSSSNSHRTE